MSARDIRRVVANAGNLQVADRVNILLRLLSAAAACGVTRALVMPDRGGIRALLERNLRREQGMGHAAGYPVVDFLDMEITSTVEDTFRATRLLREAGVRAIVVLGGDGTHRAVVRELIGFERDHAVGALLAEGGRQCPPLPPIAGISTGTNNAFPEMREPTITGMAVALYASGRLAPEVALAPRKLLEVSIDNGTRVLRDIAIVDAAITSERYVGARALWKPESLRAVYLAFADPECIGMSAIGGLLQPVGRQAPGGLAVRMAADAAHARRLLSAPIAPGMVRPVPIADWAPMHAGVPVPVDLQGGTVALDGERELAFSEADQVRITLREGAFLAVDVARCMQQAAAGGLLQAPGGLT